MAAPTTPSASWQQLKSLFHAALELEPAGRAVFLARACDGDTDLRRRVEQLLTSHDNAGLFLVSSALVDAGMITTDESAPAIHEQTRAGQRVGPYEIIREIGQGGMGTVFLAVRADDQYRKQVAIKVVNRGMNTDAILRRFVMERQILANLEHPNIARLLEGGSTADGLPYFVMEYVDGLAIDEYCDAQSQSTAQRLELFREVCGALQYAHQNLVIHRDIKPSNILITAAGVPKLLDFGIAKLLSPDWASEQGEITASMLQLMTPAYASPEQLRGLPITTAGDVYSLGVVLYELLSGHHPYHSTSRVPAEMAQVILGEEPQKPSTAVSRGHAERRRNGLEEPEPRASQKQGSGSKKTSPSKLIIAKSLRGDLDNIILKALRKEPQRRYPSVQEFSEDIRRHLAGLPVTATPDTLSYRTGKFVQRNKVGVAAGAVVLITLLTATVITSWQARVARRERARAEQRFNQVRKLAQTVLFEYHDAIVKLPGSTPLREKMVKEVIIYLDNLAGESSNDVGLQTEIAAAYQKVGDVQGNPYQANLGDIEGSLASYGKALTMRKGLLAQNPTDPETRRGLAKSHEGLGDILWVKGEYSASGQNYGETLRIYEELSKSTASTIEDNYGVARIYHRIGQVLSRKGDLEGALRSFRLGLAKFEEVTALAPDVKKFRRGKGSVFLKIGDMLSQTGDSLAASQNHRKALELWSELSLAAPLDPALKRDVVIASERIATDLEKLKDFKGALETSKQAMAMQQELVAADPQNVQYASELGTYYVSLGRIQGKTRDFLAARENFRKGLAILNDFARTTPGWADLQRDLALAYMVVGDVLSDEGVFVEAAENYRQALKIPEAETLRREDPFKLARAYEGLGDSLFSIKSGGQTKKQQENLRAAEHAYQQSLAIWLDQQNRSKLLADDVGKAEAISRKLAKCSATLDSISTNPKADRSERDTPATK